MSRGRDPFDLLSEIVEARRAQFDDGPRPEDVLRRLTPGGARPKPARCHRNRRLRAAIRAILALGIAGSGAAAWAVLHRERSTSPAIVQCLRDADLSGSSAVVSADGLAPLSRCTRLWDARVNEWGPRPPLVACVSPTGAPVVTPGDEETCQMLGLPDLDPSLTETQERLVRMQSELTEQLGASRCVPPAEAVEIAQEQLAEHQLTRWQVVLEGRFDHLAPCGAARFDIAAQTIYIQPVPDFTTSTNAPTNNTDRLRVARASLRRYRTRCPGCRDLAALDHRLPQYLRLREQDFVVQNRGVRSRILRRVRQRLPRLNRCRCFENKHVVGLERQRGECVSLLSRSSKRQSLPGDEAPTTRRRP